VLGAGSVFVWNLFEPGLEVQLATASMTSPAQANAVLTASGYVVARRKAAVASKGTGQLVYLGVEEGDTVKKGQVIARLWDEDVRAALEQARQNLRVQEADLKEAQRSLERTKTLLEKQFIAQAEYDAAEARYKRVVASIDAAVAAVKEAEAAVENTRIVAPFDGTVLNKNADIGEIVAPLAGATGSRAAVVTIADLSSLEVEADVSEANITRVFSGQPCEITLDAYPEHHYPGSVSKIVPTADRAKATVQVKIRFKSYDRRVLPEMSAKISFLPETARSDGDLSRSVLTVPASAVATRDGRQVVYQIKDGRAIAVPVVVGQQMGGQIEIKQGLKAGEKVVARVDDKLAAGSKVTVKTQ
jgi:RND family efflux transporter MFP subunit